MTAEIDWEEQWAYHAHDFQDGKAHIPLPNNQILTLYPGPGFGDFSHPTTRLMLEMMAPFVEIQEVFDIGCGSGILSLAAMKMGAKKAYICDIDPLAIHHAQNNAKHNQVELIESKPPSANPIVLMNMISSEQEIAWQNNKTSFQTLITSGILASGRESYLAFAHQNGWQLEKEFASEGWLGFIFKENLL